VRTIGGFIGRAAAVAVLCGARTPAADVPPAWLRDAFVSKQVTLTPRQRSVGLIADGGFDLRLVQRGAAPWLVLLQPGTIVVRDASEAGEAAATGASAFQQFSRLTREELGALSLGEGDDGAPHRLVGEALLDEKHVYFVRTIRPELGGGGAAARVVGRRVGPNEASASVELALDVLELDPARSLLPRRGDGWYDQELGRRERIVTIYPLDLYGHPSYGTFDLLRLDRDHLEWSGWRPRAVPHEARAVGESGLGFERRLLMERLPGRGGPPSQTWRFVELKADDLEQAKGLDVAVVDESGESVQGVWVCARRSIAGGEIASSLFSVQSDLDGRVRLPIGPRDDAATVELLAFQAGTSARFGTRRGAVVEAGGGGECVVLLDHDESTTVRVAPPPGARCLLGAHFATGSFLLPLAADGLLRLPATRERCTLFLGPPYVETFDEFDLAPGASHAITATLAAGRERRVRFVDARDGSELADAVVTFDASSLPQPVSYRGGVIVPPELAGRAVRFRVSGRFADGVAFEREVELAADAPRDQELLLAPE